MKKTVPVFVLFSCLSSVTVLADTPDDRIGWIRKEYADIRSDLNEYERYEYDFAGESAEGTHGIGYLSDTGEIRLVEVTYYGETGKVYFEFYYSNEGPFFILEKKYIYNTHFAMTEELAEEWSKEDGVVHEAFDPNKTEVEEWIYYFHDKSVVEVIGPEGTPVMDSGIAQSVLELGLDNYRRLDERFREMSEEGVADRGIIHTKRD